VAPDLNSLGPHEMRAVRVTVTMKSGEKFTEKQLYRSGHWKNPIPEAALKEKFRDLAGRVLAGEAVAEIENIVSTLETHAAPAAKLGQELQKLRA
jgi:2-methylcitrate dehydratase PrpD